MSPEWGNWQTLGTCGPIRKMWIHLSESLGSCSHFVSPGNAVGFDREVDESCLSQDPDLHLSCLAIDIIIRIDNEITDNAMMQIRNQMKGFTSTVEISEIGELYNHADVIPKETIDRNGKNNPVAK